jgi:hypothetical protein
LKHIRTYDSFHEKYITNSNSYIQSPATFGAVALYNFIPELVEN